MIYRMYSNLYFYSLFIKHLTEECNGYPTRKEIAKTIFKNFNIVVSLKAVQNIRNKLSINVFSEKH